MRDSIGNRPEHTMYSLLALTLPRWPTNPSGLNRGEKVAALHGRTGHHDSVAWDAALAVARAESAVTVSEVFPGPASGAVEVTL